MSHVGVDTRNRRESAVWNFDSNAADSSLVGNSTHWSSPYRSATRKRYSTCASHSPSGHGKVRSVYREKLASLVFGVVATQTGTPRRPKLRAIVRPLRFPPKTNAPVFSVMGKDLWTTYRR